MIDTLSSVKTSFFPYIQSPSYNLTVIANYGREVDTEKGGYESDPDTAESQIQYDHTFDKYKEELLLVDKVK